MTEFTRGDLVVVYFGTWASAEIKQVYEGLAEVICVPAWDKCAATRAVQILNGGSKHGKIQEINVDYLTKLNQ